MKLGFYSVNTPEELAPDVLGRALESRGFESLWIGEHPQIPVSRKTPYPAGGPMPEHYKRMMDPFLSLMLAAAATERLLLGTSVVLPLEHDLFDLAKTVATLDRLSGGRLTLGVGVGWNQEELANHRAIPWAGRYRALAECVGALRALWGDDEAEYHGSVFDFDPVWSYPKPLQQPHPPILCGTGGKLGTAHAVAWADGWAPLDVALGDVAKKIGLFRRAEASAGRTPMPITIVAFRDPTAEALTRYREFGVDRVVVGANRANYEDPAATIEFLDRYAKDIPALS
jgi:probable F420-dependent oxidoreductase